MLFNCDNGIINWNCKARPLVLLIILPVLSCFRHEGCSTENDDNGNVKNDSEDQ